MVKAACLESRVSWVRTPLWHSSFKETKCFFPAHSERFNIVGSLREREVAYSASDSQRSNFESCVWSAVSSHSSHHLQEVLLAQFSLHVHNDGLKPHSFHFIYLHQRDYGFGHAGLLTDVIVFLWITTIIEQILEYCLQSECLQLQYIHS